MPRYILRYKGTGTKPESDLQRIRNASTLAVIDESPRMLLVDSDAETIGHLRDHLGDWLVTPEAQISVPDPRHRIKRPID
jgi:hypothetical protein